MRRKSSKMDLREFGQRSIKAKASRIFAVPHNPAKQIQEKSLHKRFRIAPGSMPVEVKELF